MPVKFVFRVAFCLVIFGYAIDLGAATVSSLTSEQWKSDVTFLYDQMAKKHKDLYHSTSKPEFDAVFAALEAKIPTLSAEQIEVEIAKLVAKVGDGHTAMDLTAPFGMFGLQGRLAFPVELYFFSDGLFVRSADPEYSSIVGGRVLRIGPRTVEEATKAALELVSRDNEMDATGRVHRIFMIPELMLGLGLSTSADEAQFTIEKDGRQSVVTIRAKLYQGKNGWVDAAPSKDRRPLWLSHPDDYYWYQYIPESRMLYVQYNAVANKPDETVAAFFARVFSTADQSAVDRFVLDMRGNGGGNNSLNKPILLGIIRHTALDQKGKVFAIVGRETFSAAMNLANQLERFTNVTFIGEPTGGKPNSFGDNTPIETPNSKLKVFVSTLWWQDQDPRDTRPWIAPQIAADLSSTDYFEGRDPALAEILSYATRESIEDVLRKDLDHRDWAKAHQDVLEYMADRRNRYKSVENTLNRLGYELMRRPDFDAAIRTFQLEVEAYPQSFNAYDSLGEAYMKSGDTNHALENYKKSLELNPRNLGAAEAIKKLEHQE